MAPAASLKITLEPGNDCSKLWVQLRVKEENKRKEMWSDWIHTCHTAWQRLIIILLYKGLLRESLRSSRYCEYNSNKRCQKYTGIVIADYTTSYSGDSMRISSLAYLRHVISVQEGVNVVSGLDAAVTRENWPDRNSRADSWNLNGIESTYMSVAMPLVMSQVKIIMQALCAVCGVGELQCVWCCWLSVIHILNNVFYTWTSPFSGLTDY